MKEYTTPRMTKSFKTKNGKVYNQHYNSMDINSHLKVKKKKQRLSKFQKNLKKVEKRTKVYIENLNLEDKVKAQLAKMEKQAKLMKSVSRGILRKMKSKLTSEDRMK